MKLVLAALISLLCSAAMCTVKPVSLFSDNAVLQRGIEVPVWGTANDGEKVTVEFCGQKVSAVAENGKWMVRLKPLKAGGPFQMIISGENRIELSNILVGEVWVCSGQSNMQCSLQWMEGGKQAVAASHDPQLRLLSIPTDPSETAKTDTGSKWVQCEPETCADFSAVGYYFGRDLRKTLGVPVGLINAALGGTSIEAWTGKRVQIDVGLAYHQWAHSEPEERVARNHAGAMYNGMIAPLIPYGIRGALWYQGESNAGWAFQYRERLPRLIRNWREDWGQGEFPFLVVQLAPYMRIVDTPQESEWAELREAQFLASQNCPNTAVVSTMDVGNPDDVHPIKKEPVGARLALAAQGMVYGKKVHWKSPSYKNMKIAGDKIEVTFADVDQGLEVRGDKLTGFALAGADRKFYYADAKISDKNRVTVQSPSVPKPIAVRYGWANFPVANLYSKDGLPALPFRTDDFPMLTAHTAPAAPK